MNSMLEFAWNALPDSVERLKIGGKICTLYTALYSSAVSAQQTFQPAARGGPQRTPQVPQPLPLVQHILDLRTPHKDTSNQFRIVVAYSPQRTHAQPGSPCTGCRRAVCCSSLFSSRQIFCSLSATSVHDRPADGWSERVPDFDQSPTHSASPQRHGHQHHSWCRWGSPNGHARLWDLTGSHIMTLRIFGHSPDNSSSLSLYYAQGSRHTTRRYSSKYSNTIKLVNNCYAHHHERPSVTKQMSPTFSAEQYAVKYWMR